MKKTVLLLLLYFLSLSLLGSQTEPSIARLEFQNKPLRDVLAALGEAAGVSILPDETITGNVSIRFSDTSLEQILGLLSRQYGLFFDPSEEGIIEASRLCIRYEEGENLITLESNQVGIKTILQRLSRSIGKTILHDPLPAEELTLNSEKLPPRKLIELILARYPEYTLIEDSDFFFIKQRGTEETKEEQNGTPEGYITRRGTDDSYSIRMDRGDLLSLLEELFEKGGREYALLYKSPSSLRSISYNDKNFDELLSLLLTQGGGAYTIINGTYYIYDINRQDILKRFKTSEYIQLQHTAAETIPTLLPSVLSSTSFYKIDKIRNGIILSGSSEEILPIKNYILSLDVPGEGREYRKVTMDYLAPSKFMELLPRYLTTPPPLVNPDGGSFLSLLTADQFTELMSLKVALDVPIPTHILTFRYLKAEDFLKNVPPPFKSEEFTSTGNESAVYFAGSQEKLTHLKSVIKELDKPRSQVRYKLLIIQYQESEGLNHDFSFSSNLKQDDSKTTFLGSLGSLLSLNFDIVSTFGYLFSINLDYSLSSSTAHVLADTTLYGLSGEMIRFQNSSTYRYQEREVDEEGELKSTGVTQEISTGLFMDITGWVSGDDMITMEISSTLSKKGTSANSTEPSLPPTSERLINTHIRTPSGEPIIIGGLMQTEQIVTREKTPLLGNIPLLGLLFQKNKIAEENTELVIYIVPYLDRGQRSLLEPEEEFDRLFEVFFPDY